MASMQDLLGKLESTLEKVKSSGARVADLQQQIEKASKEHSDAVDEAQTYRAELDKALDAQLASFGTQRGRIRSA